MTSSALARLKEHPNPMFSIMLFWGFLDAGASNLSIIRIERVSRGSCDRLLLPGLKEHQNLIYHEKLSEGFFDAGNSDPGSVL